MMRLTRAVSLLSMICVGGAALPLRAQDSLTAEPSSKECPDLSGTYEPRSTAWIDTFHLHATGTVRPKAQTRQFATFQRRGDGYLAHAPAGRSGGGPVAGPERSP